MNDSSEVFVGSFVTRDVWNSPSWYRQLSVSLRLRFESLFLSVLGLPEAIRSHTAQIKNAWRKAIRWNVTSDPLSYSRTRRLAFKTPTNQGIFRKFHSLLFLLNGDLVSDDTRACFFPYLSSGNELQSQRKSLAVTQAQPSISMLFDIRCCLFSNCPKAGLHPVQHVGRSVCVCVCGLGFTWATGDFYMTSWCSSCDAAVALGMAIYILP